jgi:hypothetical protein
MSTGSLRLLYALGGVALAGAILWAFGQAPFWESAVAVARNPWGLVTLVDLYVGFLMIGLLIGVVERWPWWIWPMIVISFGLGNVVYAVWGVLRLRRLAAR